VDLVGWLRAHELSSGALVGLTVGPNGSVTVAGPGGTLAAGLDELATADREVRPRWVVWSQETARALVDGGVRLSMCWDVAAVHRQVHVGGGGGRPA
jgi:DNA polymerase-1